MQRAPLHPLLALRERGQSEEEIAAAFFVSVHVVRQRLRLASVSPQLLDVYAEDGISLEQLMAFTANPDHARQTQVWEALQRTPIREPYQIRRMLTESAVRASGMRAQFVGVADYEAAGGIVLRDLFEDRRRRLAAGPGPCSTGSSPRSWSGKPTPSAPRAGGGSRWPPTFPYGHTYGLRRLSGKEVPLTKKEAKARDALKAELDKLEKKYADAEEIPEEVDTRLGEIETALGEFDQRHVVYDPSEIPAVLDTARGRDCGERSRRNRTQRSGARAVGRHGPARHLCRACRRLAHAQRAGREPRGPAPPALPGCRRHALRCGSDRRSPPLWRQTHGRGDEPAFSALANVDRRRFDAAFRHLSSARARRGCGSTAGRSPRRGPR